MPAYSARRRSSAIASTSGRAASRRGNRPDFGDGLAGHGHPVVNPVVVALALAGLGLPYGAGGVPSTPFVLAAVLSCPLGALATDGDGLFRRTFGLAPFVALLAALPLAWVWERAAARSDRRGLVAVARRGAGGRVPVRRCRPRLLRPRAGRCLCALHLSRPGGRRRPLHRASLPPGTIVYFYSDRWAFNYETTRFIAPNAEGIDRSVKFGGLGFLGDPLGFGADRIAPVSVRVPRYYLGDAREVTDRYAGGTVTEGSKRGYETHVPRVLPAAVAVSGPTAFLPHVGSPPRAVVGASRPPLRASASRVPQGERQLRERRPSPGRRLDPHLAAMRPHDLPRDRQPESAA